MPQSRIEAISLKLPDELLREADRIAESLEVSRAEYIRNALQEKNQRVLRQRRRERMQRASERVRGESMEVNREFETLDDDDHS